jgi:hypothetical protein
MPKNWNNMGTRDTNSLSKKSHSVMGRVVLGFFVVFGAVPLAKVVAQPYIATSQNFFCAGQSDPVSLYCNVLAFDPTTNVADWTFEWSPAADVSDPNAQSVLVTPMSTSTFSAVMTSPSGEVFEDDITITVYPDFEVDAGPDLFLCSTLGASLVASVDIVNSITWEWQPAVGLSNAMVSNPQLTEELSQVYTVTATIDGLGATGCFATDVVEVASVFPDMELGDDVVACAGELVTIDPELPANYAYEWSEPGAILPTLDVTTSGTYGLTVTSPEGCVHSDVLNVVFTDGPVLTLPDSTTTCASPGVLLDAMPTNLATGPFQFNWSHGPNDAVVLVNESGTYQIMVKDAGGCATSAAIAVLALASPEFYLPSDTALCFDDYPGVQYALAVPAGFGGYLWDNGSTSNSLLFSGPGSYGVVVTNDIGCESEQNTLVQGFCSVPTLFIPTAFSPDGDGLNEVLRIEGRNLVQLDFKLFNRWGNLVWQADSIGDYWHAQSLSLTHYVQDELYIWKAKYRHYTDPSGSLSTWFEAEGAVRVLR